MKRKITLKIAVSEAQLNRLFKAIDYALQSDPMMGLGGGKSLRIAREAIRAAYYDKYVK